MADLNRKLRIALDDLSPQLGLLSLLPQIGTIANAIEQWPSISTIAVLERSRDANEFRFEIVAGDANHCVTVTSHIHEGKVWRQIRVGQSPRFADVATSRILQARPDAVPKQ